jgi:hypothetical protein
LAHVSFSFRTGLVVPHDAASFGPSPTYVLAASATSAARLLPYFTACYPLVGLGSL